MIISGLPASEIKVFDFIRNFMDSFRYPIFRLDYRVSGSYEFCAREWVLDEIFHDELYESTNWITRMKMECGTVMHYIIQNRVLGPAGVLWGEWKCLKCGIKYRGFMPKELCSCSDSCKLTCIWPGDKSNRVCQLCPRYGSYEYIEPVVELMFDKHKLVGHADGILYFNGRVDSANMRVLEVKTIDPRLFTQLEMPFESHYSQVNIYMHLLNCRQATLLYIDRSLTVLPYFKEFFVEYDELAVKNILSNIERGDKYLVDIDKITFDTLPVRICNTKSDMRARKCPYRDKCFDDKYLLEVMKNRSIGGNAHG